MRDRAGFLGGYKHRPGEQSTAQGCWPDPASAFAASQLGPGEGGVRWDRIGGEGAGGPPTSTGVPTRGEHSGDWLSTPKSASNMLCTLGQVTLPL